MYKITEHSYDKAKELGVIIKPSTNKKKKIDVFKNGQKVASIGAIGCMDYPTYLKEYPHIPYLAEKKRELYKLRHKDDIKNKEGNGYYSFKILWS